MLWCTVALYACYFRFGFVFFCCCCLFLLFSVWFFVCRFHVFAAHRYKSVMQRAAGTRATLLYSSAKGPPVCHYFIEKLCRIDDSVSCYVAASYIRFEFSCLFISKPLSHGMMCLRLCFWVFKQRIPCRHRVTRLQKPYALWLQLHKIHWHIFAHFCATYRTQSTIFFVAMILVWLFYLLLFHHMYTIFGVFFSAFFFALLHFSLQSCIHRHRRWCYFLLIIFDCTVHTRVVHLL